MSKAVTNQRPRASRWWAGSLALCAGLWSAAPVAAAELSRQDLLWLDRLSFGLDASSVADLQRLGRKAWLAEQLRPTSEGLPPAVQARMEALPLPRSTPESLGELLTQRQAMRTLPGGALEERRDILREQARVLADAAMHRTMLRAVHSRWQLREVMSWFWFNHFNILVGANLELSVLAGDYGERAIRPHALGRFRDLLEAVATHPAMLVYLNNDRNTAGNINENYARELMELHTLGVDGGYTQQDVQQLALVLTGLGLPTELPGAAMAASAPPPQRGASAAAGRVTMTEGMAVFRANRHAEEEHVLLGQPLDGKGWAQIQQALDLLARHPSTARHIARKLATYFVADEPPPALVQRLAQRFTQTDGDMAAVITTLAESPELEASLDRKFKDPMQFVISGIRLTLPPDQVLELPRRVQAWLGQLGQPLWGRRTPDGYPLTAAAWSGPTQLNQRFQVAHQIAAGIHMGSPWPAVCPTCLSADTPFVRETLLPLLPPTTREVLTQARKPQEWRTLLLASPEFMTR